MRLAVDLDVGLGKGVDRTRRVRRLEHQVAADLLFSVGFFNLFPQALVAASLGLFAETLVPSRDFAKLKDRVGIREAFEKRDQIDIDGQAV